MLYRQLYLQIRKSSLNNSDFYRKKVASLHHFEAKKNETFQLSSINMPLFKLDAYQFNRNIPTLKAMKKLEKEHGQDFNILFSAWSTSHKKIQVWKLTYSLREIVKECISLLGKQDIFYQIHYHYFPAFYSNQDILIEQLIQALQHMGYIDQYNLGKFILKEENRLKQTQQFQNQNQSNQKTSFPFEGSGNLCDVLHNQMPQNIKYWLNFYSQNNPMIIKGGYDDCYLNFRISCSYILYNNSNREKIYKDFKRIRDLNFKVFDFLEYFNQITNDEAKKEFFCKRFFKQFEYECEDSLKLLIKLTKQYQINQIIQWIDLLILMYEESYYGQVATIRQSTKYPQLKGSNFL
ncbi:hypothetical protein ABPG72_005829 [Tetrahymena utriculariae]